MERIVIKPADANEIGEMLTWLEGSRDGQLFDVDVLEHESTMTLCALGSVSRRMAYLPIQQPLMLESFSFRPDLTEAQKAIVLIRLAEYAVSEAFRRNAGEIYFLSRDPDTVRLAERRGFRELPDGLKVYRLNLRETFGG